NPLLVIILLLGVLPSLLIEQQQAKVKWDIWHVKGDSSRRFHKISYMLQNKQDLSDIKLFGLRTYMSAYARRMLGDFNDEQQNTLRRFIRPALLARLFESILVAGIQIWLITK